MDPPLPLDAEICCFPCRCLLHAWLMVSQYCRRQFFFPATWVTRTHGRLGRRCSFSSSAFEMDAGSLQSK